LPVPSDVDFEWVTPTMAGRTIKIFLVDGTPSGFRTAELGLSTIKAVVVPRASLSAVAKRNELQKTGIYLLIGTDSENPGDKKLYVGEGDTILTRLTIHNSDPEKDWWDEAVFFVSKDENLTKSHVRFLEARLIGLAKNAKRATVVNGTSPPEHGKLPECDAVEMEEFIVQAKLLLGTLGYDLFEPAPSLPAQAAAAGQNKANERLPKFIYAGAGYSATCIVDLDAGKFIVQAGSTARKEESKTLSPSSKKWRARLKENGVLVEHDDLSFKFSQDYSFKSISSAAQVVSGSTVNGRGVWRTTDSIKTFADWQDEQLKDIEIKVDDSLQIVDEVAAAVPPNPAAASEARPAESQK